MHVAEDRETLGVAPVVNDRLEDVDVTARGNGLEEAPTDRLDSVAYAVAIEPTPKIVRATIVTVLCPQRSPRDAGRQHPGGQDQRVRRNEPLEL